MKPAVLLLTCSNNKEADTIARALLKQRLVACAKKIPVSSRFRWQGSIDTAEEVVLLLESNDDKFSDIENTVRKLHSHSTFVLMAFPASKVSRGVKQWLNTSLR